MKFTDEFKVTSRLDTWVKGVITIIVLSMSWNELTEKSQICFSVPDEYWSSLSLRFLIRQKPLTNSKPYFLLLSTQFLFLFLFAIFTSFFSFFIILLQKSTALEPVEHLPLILSRVCCPPNWGDLLFKSFWSLYI